MRATRSSTLLLGAAWLAVALPVRAEPVRALVLGPASAPVIARIEDELAALGVTYSFEEWGELPTRGVVRNLADARGASVVIAVSPEGMALEVWAEDPATGRLEGRSIVAPPGDPEDSARIAALQTAEVLRIHLRGLQPVAPAGSLVGSGTAAPASADLPARWWVRAAGGLLWAPGGLDPTASLVVELQWLARVDLSVGLSAAFPLTAARATGPEGFADVRPWLAFAEARWRPLGGVGWFQPDLGLALGIAVVTMEGTAEAPRRGVADTVTSFAWHVAAGLEARPLDWLAVRLDTQVGMAVPEVGVAFVGRRVARWGMPFVGTAVGIAVGW